MENKNDSLIIILLVTFTVLVYANSIFSPFIFDDNHMLVDNTFITNPRYIPMFFKGYVTSFPVPRGMFRPLLMLTFMFNYANGKLNPIGYHIINILFHFLNATLLYFLLRTLKKDIPRIIATFTSLLFVVHPLNTEAITYISSRSDLMVTSLLLLGFLLYLKKRIIPASFCYIAALLTKETALCFPIITGANYVVFSKEHTHKNDKNKQMVFLGILAVITIIYLVYRRILTGKILPGNTPFDLTNILLQSWCAFFYLKLFLWPHPLNLLHQSPPNQFLTIASPLCIAAIIVLVIFSLFADKKKNKLLITGIIWYLGGMLPKFYSVLHVPLMEHHFYLPGIGIYFVISYLVEKFFFKKNLRLFMYPAAGVIILFSLLTIWRNHQYNNPHLIWQQGTVTEPYNVGNWINLSIAYRDEGNLKKAKDIIEKALSLKEDTNWRSLLYINLANICIKEKKYKQAEDILQKLYKLPLRPLRRYQIDKFLSTVYLQTAQYNKALYFTQEALRIAPYSAREYQRLSEIYIKMGDLEKAENSTQKAIHLSPDNFYSYFLLGKIEETKGNLKRAERMYKKSISLNPEWFYSHYALALVYIKERNPLFIKEMEKVILLKPDFAPALTLLKHILRK